MSNFKRMDQLLSGFADRTVPGCACTIMKKGEIIYDGYAGYSDIENKSKVNEHSMFRQASTTKLFTYAILGMLYEEGKFLFTDPISDYLPEWKQSVIAVKRENGELEFVPAKRPITVKDATTMACGLPYCMFPDPNAKDPTTAAMSKKMKELMKDGKRPVLREEVRAMSDVPLRFEPGTHWLYGFGSEIVGAIVEVLEQKNLRDVFTDRIINLLDLRDTATFIDDEIAKKLVSMYRKQPDGKLVKAPKEMDRDMLREYTPEGARASLMSSSRDFSVFMQMLANGGTYRGKQLLNKGTVRMISSNCLSAAQLDDFHCDYLAGYGYGYGFRTLMDQGAGNHNGFVGAFGWTGGAGTWVEADPNTGVSIVYMHNMAPNEELYHHHRVRAVAYGCIDE